jgi:signal transduction histidine kinase/ActR/RegA family two-component response regulator
MHRDSGAGTSPSTGAAMASPETLERVARLLAESFEVSDLAQRIAESALPLFGASSSIAWLRQSDGSLICGGVAGRTSESLKIGDVLLPDNGVAGHAVVVRHAWWAADAPEAFGETVLAVPLIARAEVIGAIVTGYGAPRDLGPDEIALVEMFAERLAPAMRNVQLFAGVQAARAVADAASRAKDEFLALLAHEFRNSLAPIMTSAALIQRAGPPLDIVQNSADIVERQARHLARLLDDLLDVSRIARGTIELRRERVSLGAFAEGVFEASRSLADTAGLTISLMLPSLPVWVEADPTRLQEVLANLLNNAIRYTPPGGRIQVTVAAEDDEAVLRVGDTGIGIVPQMLPHIFDLFVRGPRARIHARDGLGIGLTLVRHLVEIHGGRVAARSDGPDRGSEFTVRLPLAVGAEADCPAAAVTPRSAAYDVLVIEDNVDARETLRDLLEHEGHRVDVAGDGPSGLARAEANRPQVVLIDLELPGLSGYAIAARIRARRAGEPLLVAVTGYADAEHRRRSIEAGFDAHLTKPVLSDDLIGVLGLVASRSPRAVPSGRADVADESDRRS